MNDGPHRSSVDVIPLSAKRMKVPTRLTIRMKLVATQNNEVLADLHGEMGVRLGFLSIVQEAENKAPVPAPEFSKPPLP
jgi:hypothetical protein